MKTPADSTLAKGVPTDGRAKKFRSQKLLLILVRLVAVERLIDGRAVVDDFANGEEHRDGGIRLEDIPEGVYLLNAAPLNLSGADGSPCRAVLIDTER